MIESTAKWVTGEVAQGKIMLAVAMLLLAACFFLWQSGSPLQRGVSVPLAIVLLVNLAYGGWLLTGRPALLEQVKQSYEQDTAATLTAERERANNEIQAYGKFKIAWSIILACSLIALFILSAPFLYGLALGFLLLASSALTIDAFLLNRITLYAESLARF